MKRALRGLTRPECLSRFGRAASVSLPVSSGDSPQRNTEPVSEEVIKKLLRESSGKEEKKSTAPSSSFLAVSRTQVEYATRNKTGSPDVGRYHPNYDVGRLRTDRSPQYSHQQTSPRGQRIYLPPCLARIETTYPRHDRTGDGNLNVTFDDVSKRTVADLKKYAETVEGKNMLDPPPLESRPKGLVALDQQLIRPQFVRDDGPPNPKRFASTGHDSLVVSLNRRVPGISFIKALERRELFDPRPLPDYRPSTRLTRRGSPQIVAFSKRTGRRSLALEHMLKSPPQVAQARIDRGWGAIKASPGKMPRLASVSPRDDLMYRTNGSYKLNVPRKQLATAVPSFQGDVDKPQRQSPAASITFYL